MSRMVVLTEGHLDLWTAKTAVPVLRYRPKEVACVLDSRAAGKDLSRLVGTGAGIPIVATLREALRLKPDTLLIGIAPPGGRLPASWRRLILDALAAGLDVVSGLHVFLADDPVLADAARRRGRTLRDLRRVPEGIGCSRNLARLAPCRRVLTVGSDCAVGKLTVSLELAAEARRRGWDCDCAATGQTGILLTGSGIPVDRTISDFASGAAEKLVLERAGRELVVIEGQGSIAHPAYSAVTLGLLHGSAPHAMVLCHDPRRRRTLAAGANIPPLPELIRLYEGLAALVLPAPVVAIALNTFGMSLASARRAIARAERAARLAADDVVRFGPGRLMDAVEQSLGGRRRRKPGGPLGRKEELERAAP